MDACSMPALGIQTLRMQVAEQGAAIERHKLAVIEMVDRMARNERNITAADRTIDELRLASPNGAIGQQKVKMEIAAQQHTIERQVLENLEALERIKRSLENAEAAKKAREEYAKNLADMEKAHGPLTDEAFLALIPKEG